MILEILNQLANGTAWWGILHVGYRLLKDFPAIATSYIDFYEKHLKPKKNVAEPSAGSGGVLGSPPCQTSITAPLSKTLKNVPYLYTYQITKDLPK